MAFLRISLVTFVLMSNAVGLNVEHRGKIEFLSVHAAEMLEVVAEDDERYGIAVASDENLVDFQSERAYYMLNYWHIPRWDKWWAMHALKFYRNVIIAVANDDQMIQMMRELQERLILSCQNIGVITERDPYEVFDILLSRMQFPVHFGITHRDNVTREITHYVRRCLTLEKVDSISSMTKDYPFNECFEAGDVLRVAAFHYPPTVSEYFDENGDRRFYGMETSLVQAVADSVGLETEFSIPQRFWEKWAGARSDIEQNRKDIGIGQYFYYFQYSVEVGMTRPFDLAGVCYLLRRPDVIQNWTSLVLPFTWFGWVAILVSFTSATAILVIWVIFRKPKGVKANHAIWFTYNSLMGQGTNMEPRSWKLRAFVCLLGWCTLIITNIYSGSLLSVLAITIEPEPIQRIADLIHFPGDIASIFNYMSWTFGFPGKPEYDALISKTVGFYGDDLMEEFLNKTGQGKMVFTDTDLSLEFHLRTRFVDKFGQSRMYIMDECWQFQPLSMMLIRNGPYFDLFNRKIGQIVEAGLINKWKRDDFDRIAQLSSFQSVSLTAVEPLGLNDFKGIFGLLCLGFALTILVFLSEVYIGNLDRLAACLRKVPKGFMCLIRPLTIIVRPMWRILSSTSRRFWRAACLDPEDLKDHN